MVELVEQLAESPILLVERVEQLAESPIHLVEMADLVDWALSLTTGCCPDLA